MWDSISFANEDENSRAPPTVSGSAEVVRDKNKYIYIYVYIKHESDEAIQRVPHFPLKEDTAVRKYPHHPIQLCGRLEPM